MKMWFSKELKLGLQIVSNYLFIYFPRYIKITVSAGNWLYNITHISKIFADLQILFAPKFLIESKA